MKRQVVERLLTAAGLSLLLAIGVMLSLGVSIQAQGTGPVELEVVALPSEVAAGEYVTLTAKVLDTGLLTVTEMYLEFGLPPASALIPDPPLAQPGILFSAEDLEALEPGESLLHDVRLRAMEDISGTFAFTATVSYTFTREGGGVDRAAVSVGGEIIVVVAVPVSPESPLPSPTPGEDGEPPPPVPSATPTATSPPSPPPTPTSTPQPEISPTPSPAPVTPSIIDQAIEFVTSEPLLSLAICLGPLAILLLVLILIMLTRRRRRVAPPAPGPSVPPAPRPPAGPYLEGVDAAGTAHRFALTGDLSVGRAPENDLVITEDYPGNETVSRHHARIYHQGAFWIVEDLQSSNGVYVDGKRTGLNRLLDNCRLGIGGVEFVFHAGKEASDELS
jgi:hypothetical protein